MKLLIVQFSQFSPPIWSDYIPRHPILKHVYSKTWVVFLQCARDQTSRLYEKLLILSFSEFEVILFYMGKGRI